VRKFRGVSEVFPNNFLFINKGKFGIFTKFRGIKVFYTFDRLI
jgi:hypothetical protein